MIKCPLVFSRLDIHFWEFSEVTTMNDTADFFRSRLDQMIDLRHPLSVLASRIPWKEIEASIAYRFARHVRAGKTLSDVDLFGSTVLVSGASVSKAHQWAV
jgi:IS5 family transposase